MNHRIVVAIAIGITCTSLIYEDVGAYGASADQLETSKSIYRELNSAVDIPMSAPVQVESTQDSTISHESYYVQAIRVEGTPVTHKLQYVLDHFSNRVLTSEDIQTLITQIYTVLGKEGYVLVESPSISYDLKTESLSLHVRPSKILSFSYAKDSERTHIQHLFPHVGSKLNIYDLEQGLENLRKIRPADMYMQKLDNSPDVNVVVRADPVALVEGSFTISNEGDEATGRYQDELQLVVNDPLRLSDKLIVGGTREHLNTSAGKRYRSYYASYTVPYKKYQLSITHQHLHYRQPLEIGDSIYHYGTNSSQWKYQVIRLLYRDRVSKLQVQVGFQTYDKKSYLGDVDLGVQQVQTRVWQGGFNYYRQIPRGIWYGAVNIKQDRSSYMKDHQGSSRPLITELDISYRKYLSCHNHNLEHRILFHGQYATGEVPSHQAISIGSLYTVRGFKNNDSLSAPSGWYMQQELRLMGKHWSPYLGLDIGALYPKQSSTTTLAGASAGIQYKNKQVWSEVSISTPLKYPKSMKPSKTVMYGRVGVYF